MKKQSLTIIRRGINCSLVTVSFLLNSFALHATVGTDPLKKASFNYVGRSNNYLTFNINYHNKEQKKFVLQLIDKATDDVLYEREYKDSAFKKNIYLLVENPSCSVTFRIKSGREIYRQSFNIYTESKLVDNLSVTKL